MPISQWYKALTSRISTVFRWKRFVHTEGVTGSIPVTPTIQFPRFSALPPYGRSHFTKCSIGLAKPAIVISALCCAQTPAAARDILQFQLYSLNNPTECPSTGPTVIKWSAEADRDIRAVDRSVNHSIIPRDEPPGQDLWQADVRYGDCDDFTMTKRRALIRLGYPPRALRPRTFHIGKIGHAVLDVHTSKRVYTLDNLRSVR